MILIDSIKPNVEKVLFFYATVLGRGVKRVQNKTSYVSFRVRFAGGNKILFKINKKEELYFFLTYCKKVKIQTFFEYLEI